MEKISVIIVHWNVPGSLKHCLESLWLTEYPNLEVIVIDNASQKPLHLVKVKLIQNTENFGFPRAVNQGLKIATGEYLLVLNPDTRVEKDFFIKALDFAKTHSEMGVLGPKFVNPDGTVQGSVFKEPSLFGSSQKYSPTTICEVSCVSGGCMFIPKNVVRKIGLFTEEVFMYYEDFDYCRRIRQAGLKVYFNPEIQIIHEHGQSSAQNPQAIKYLQQSSLWYNGPIKHYAMWFIAWISQKFRKINDQQ